MKKKTKAGVMHLQAKECQRWPKTKSKSPLPICRQHIVVSRVKENRVCYPKICFVGRRIILV